VGKSIYEFSDEARYNDYVLIDETPDAPQTAKKKQKPSMYLKH